MQDSWRVQVSRKPQLTAPRCRSARKEVTPLMLSRLTDAGLVIDAANTSIVMCKRYCYIVQVLWYRVKREHFEDSPNCGSYRSNAVALLACIVQGQPIETGILECINHSTEGVTSLRLRLRLSSL